ncbi:41988_t:CDS:2 [Gigaspora margarita]|uniref:41988_t:CDS:1 n=1 Tax=Gigaspora margarita TaxID=4874 RepID=A0ABN7VT99_GIGMA|nr:41988_t:CDS:2 [Gigaspora margarita]
MDVMELVHVFVTSNNTMDVMESDPLWMLWSQSNVFVPCNNIMDVMESDRVFGPFNNCTMDVMESDRVFGTFNNSIRGAMESKDVFKPFDEILVDKSIVESGCTFVTFDEAHTTIKRYASVLKHNHYLYLDALKFITVMRKLDKDDLGRKYTHKPDVYNAVSCYCQRKLQGLGEIKMLFMTLCDDKNIVGYAALKETCNTE